ncbi:MAG TPA: molybdenum cofactor biosynthesis protein MoaE [Bacteroidota bacterium]|nr:molybdenum cofactor biosynthesis protein MoaE [Bacteroidota bacterium]
MQDIVKIVREKINPDEILASVADDRAGGTAVFIGTTRNHSQGAPVEYVEYEAYEPMAIGIMTDIARTARFRWELFGLSAVHRVGRVDVGEAGVVIAVSAAHRAGAFEACRYLIDAVKKDAPIWKKEVYAGKQTWVGL